MQTQAKTKRPNGAITTLSLALKISKRRTAALLAAGMPDQLDQAAAWRRARQAGSDSVEELRRERILLVQSQRQAVDLSNQVKRGQFVPAGQAEEFGAAVGFVMKSTLLRMSNDLPPTLEGLAAVAIGVKLREASDKILATFADELRRFAITTQNPDNK
jgi:hypothetical protein